MVKAPDEPAMSVPKPDPSHTFSWSLSLRHHSLEGKKRKAREHESFLFVQIPTLLSTGFISIPNMKNTVYLYVWSRQLLLKN